MLWNTGELTVEPGWDNSGQWGKPLRIRWPEVGGRELDEGGQKV